MLIVEVGEREAMPVRAIPLVTGGSLDARQLIDMFWDPESWAQVPDTVPHDQMCSVPRAFRVASDASVSPTRPTFWSLPRERARHRAMGEPDAADQLKLLPAGVLVWIDEFRPFYEAHAEYSEMVRPAPAGAFGWEPDVTLNLDQQEIVWEGLEAVRDERARRPQQRNSRKQHLESLGIEVDAVVAACAEHGLHIEKCAMPGNKSDLIDILKVRNPRRGGRSRDTYELDFRELGLKWVGGKNRRDRGAFRACFNLGPPDKQDDHPK